MAADTTTREAVRALGATIRAQAERIELERRLPIELVRALARAGVFRLCVPRALGGEEAEPDVIVGTLEDLARADGSTGWCAMIGATSGVTSAYLPEREAREIFGTSREVIAGGVFAPMGSATREGADYRVTGRWRFASGCQHCDWLMGGCMIRDDGPPRARMALFPAGDAEIVDTWTVSGLRGTGSHDMVVRDLRVPITRSVSITDERPVAEGALYAFPVFGLLAIGIAAVALGIARGALDEIERLASEKTPTGSRRLLVERPVVQAQIAEAEAAAGAARAFLREVIDEAWTTARAAGAIPIALRGRLRLAATHATTASARAVDVAYTAGGGTAVYAESPLQRAFRDIHVVTQHMMVAPATWELAGRVLLGVDTDTTML
jgi:alkylation response protein AidB-like acyl-CoA dehydrogenase